MKKSKLTGILFNCVMLFALLALGCQAGEAVIPGEAAAKTGEKVIFHDDFEKDLAQWEVVHEEQAGKTVESNPRLAAEQFHSGKASLKLSGKRGITRHRFDRVCQGIVTIWVYDSLDKGARGFALMQKGVPAFITINTSEEGGNPGYYNYRFGSQGYKGQIKRTKGWHKFTWDYSTGKAGVVLSIDGQKIGASDMVTGFDTIMLGVNWDAGMDIYIDDLSVVDISRDHAVRLTSGGMEREIHYFSTLPVCFDLEVRRSARIDQTEKLPLSWLITDASGKTVKKDQGEVVMEPGQEKVKKQIDCTPDDNGIFEIVAHLGGQTEAMCKTMFVREISEKRKTAAAEELQLKLVDMIDCVVAPDSAREYKDDGKASVAETSLGKYRRTEGRFSYQIHVKNPAMPHLLSIEYPDDDERCFAFLIREGWDLYNWRTCNESGVSTGREHPLSNAFHDHRVIFWPNTTNPTVTVINYQPGKTAAVSKIALYEIEGGLPELVVYEPDNEPKRLLGLHWDTSRFIPANFSRDWTSDMKLKRWYSGYRGLVSYMKYTGQNLLSQAVTFVRKSEYPSVVMDNRDEPDYMRMALEMCQAHELKFMPVVYLWGADCLEPQTVRDKEAIRKGAPTLCQVSREGATFTVENSAGFNPVHPKAQSVMLRIMDELLDQYGDYKSLHGISFFVDYRLLGAFGLGKGPADNEYVSDGKFYLDWGYDDYTVALFEKDTGITVPVSGLTPDRFAKRYEWLMQNALPLWIQWRNDKVAELYLKLYNKVKAKRADLTFHVTYRGLSCPELPAWKTRGIDAREILRGFGLDPQSFKNKEGLFIDRLFHVGADRRFRFYAYPTKNFQAYRDWNFSPEVAALFNNGRNTGVFLLNTYFELDDASIVPVIAPAHCHFMESYASVMALSDPAVIFNGGWAASGIAGHEKQVREFARAYRALPAEAFGRIFTSRDNKVTLRELDREPRRYFYLVNTSYDESCVEVQLEASDGKPAVVTDLVSGKSRKLGKSGYLYNLRRFLQNLVSGKSPKFGKGDAGPVLSVKLAPYELRSFSLVNGKIRTFK